MNQNTYVDVVLRSTHSLMVDSFIKQCEEKYDESTLYDLVPKPVHDEGNRKLKQMLESLIPLLDLADKQQPLTRTTLVDKRVKRNWITKELNNWRRVLLN